MDIFSFKPSMTNPLKYDSTKAIRSSLSSDTSHTAHLNSIHCFPSVAISDADLARVLQVNKFNMESAAKKKKGAAVLKNPLDEIPEITLDNSNIAKALLSDTTFLAACAIPRKEYVRYLAKNVYLSLDKQFLTPAIVWAFSVSGATDSDPATYITSATQSYDHIFFIQPCNTAAPALSIPIKRGESYISERSKSLMFKAIPPIVLAAEKIPTFTSHGLDALPKHVIRIELYKDIVSRYSSLVDAYDMWQNDASTAVPLQIEGHDNISRYAQDQSGFENFLRENAEVFPDQFIQHQQLVQKTKLSVTPSLSPTSVTPTASPGTTIAKHPQSDLMESVTQNLDSDPAQPSIAVSPSGDARVLVVMKKDLENKLDAVITDVQDNKGFVFLLYDQSLMKYTNSDGNQINYLAACNQDGTVLVTVCVVFSADGKPSISMISTNRITNKAQKEDLKQQYAHFKALQSEYEDAIPDVIEDASGIGDAEIEPESDDGDTGVVSEDDNTLLSDLDDIIDIDSIIPIYENEPEVVVKPTSNTTTIPPVRKRKPIA